MLKTPEIKPAAGILIQQQFSRVAVYLVLAVISISLLVLVGWQFKLDALKRPLPEMVAMNPTTAVLFILSGVAFLLLTNKHRNTRSRKTGYTLSCVILAVSLLRTLDILFDLNIRVDRILFSEKLVEDALLNISNHMAPNTTAGFILSGTSLMFLHNETRGEKIPSNYFAILAALLGLFSLIGYLYNVPTFYGVLSYIPMAIHTAFSFFCLSLAILFAHPGKGFMKLLTGTLIGSVTARLLIPFAILVPVTLGLLRLYGYWTGLFSTEFGVAILVLSIIIVFLMIIWYNALLLNKRDLRRIQVEENVIQFNEELEDQVRKKTDELVGIFERITDGFIALDKNFCYTYVNKKTGELVRRDPKTLIGKNTWEEFPRPKDSPTYRAFLQAMEEQRYIVNVDYYAPLDLWQENHIYPSPEGLSVFIKDITERKKAEDLVRFKANLLNTVGQAVIATDMEGTINFWNAAAEKIYGWPADEALGKNIVDITPAQQTREQAAEVMKVLSEGNFWSGEFLVQRRDGSTFPAFVTDSPIFDQDGKLTGMIGVSVDITERKKAEAVLESLQLEILEQKIQEQKKISRAIIKAQEEEKNHLGRELHDNISQILAGAKIYLAVAAKKDDQIKALLKYPMELIDDTAEEIRLLSQKQVTPVKDINLEELILELLESIKINNKANTDFIYMLPDNNTLPDDLKLNIYRIIQVQVNNIIRHADAKNVNLSIKEQNGIIEIVMTDDGKGFNTTSKRKGIGISNMINRIESYNGTSTIKSTPGCGCTIMVKIPVLNNNIPAS